MCKLIVSMPAGWDNRLIMESKDFALLCDIVERSQGFTRTYRDGTYYNVAKQMLIEGSMNDGTPVITQDEFDALPVKESE